MRRLFVRALSVTAAIYAAAMLTLSAAEAKTLGIVALLANDALNIDVIGGATEAAKAAGWDVKVIDTQASADQANAAMNSSRCRRSTRSSCSPSRAARSARASQAANAADIPVATWGGEIVAGIVVTTSGQTGRRGLGRLPAQQDRRRPAKSSP